MMIKNHCTQAMFFGDGGVTQDFARTNNLGDTLKPTAKDITSVVHFSNWDFLRRHPERGTFVGNCFASKPQNRAEEGFFEKISKKFEKTLDKQVLLWYNIIC
ncbi:MAG: hypothetical protein IKR76_06460 [Ruminococcus sp.]|nr:hypothetical protein [Ruminococcus sp.]